MGELSVRKLHMADARAGGSCLPLSAITLVALGVKPPYFALNASVSCVILRPNATLHWFWK